jgi:beta-N-acetylhexosaminidase
MRLRLVGTTLAALAAVAVAATAQARSGSTPTLAQLVGQHLLVRMQGSTPSASFLRRIRAGEIGGVVLFQNNATPAHVPALVAKLQAAARMGGQLPLVIAVDQEGGAIKRLPGPPTLAPRSMTTASVARAQGLSTARYLRGLGINSDLAPVLDVPSSRSAFIYSRAFSTSPAAVASRGVSFADGLLAGGVAPTAKHFPGLGRLSTSTDTAAQTVSASKAALASDVVPFKRAISEHIPAIMVGTAVYPAYGDSLPAAVSPHVVTNLLRGALHFTGVTLSDDLDTAAVWGRIPPVQAAVQAVRVGIDMVYIAGVNGSGGDAIGERAYAALLHAATDGTLSRSALDASYARIAAFKARYTTG